MPQGFRPGSAEARIAEKAELALKRRVISEGGLILRTSLAGGGFRAAMFEGPQGKFRAPDLLTSVWRGASCWEVKSKGGADDLRKLNVLRHGIDFCCFEDYSEIERKLGLPVGVAIIQLCKTRGEFDRCRARGFFPNKPRLLVATLAHLTECLKHGDMHFGKPSEKFPSGSVNWDVGDFIDCGDIEIGTLGTLPAGVQLNLHAWERPDRFGSLPDVPIKQQQSHLPLDSMAELYKGRPSRTKRL